MRERRECALRVQQGIAGSRQHRPAACSACWLLVLSVAWRQEPPAGRQACKRGNGLHPLPSLLCPPPTAPVCCLWGQLLCYCLWGQLLCYCLYTSAKLTHRSPCLPVAGEKFGVQGFPTLKWFPRGKASAPEE